MKRFIFVFLALLLALCPSVSAAAASDPLFSQTASGDQNQPADANTQTEAPEAQAPEESETQAETELQPVLLDTDQVSTEDILMYASACIVMDTNTGAILYYKNMLDRKYPASTTKIMTTLLALDRTSMADTITFSENAINSITWDSSNMELKAGNSLTLEETLYGIMLASANEASNGLAEYVSGSMETFAADMTDYAIQLGCRRTHFTNPSGLHDDQHYTTAKDMAIIASAAAHNETFRQISGSAVYTIENPGFKVMEPETGESSTGDAAADHAVSDNTQTEGGDLIPQPYTLYNHHKMVNHTYPYEYCYGGKTGYTEEARNTLVTFASKDQMDLVCVVLDCPGGKNYIYMDTEKALNYCFDHYDQLNAEYLARCEASKRMDFTVFDWYTMATPLAAEEMFFPFAKQSFEIYKPLALNKADQKALNNAIENKSIEEFIDYSRAHDYKPLMIAASILVIALIILTLLVIKLWHVLKRKRSRIRYQRLRKKRMEEDIDQ